MQYGATNPLIIGPAAQAGKAWVPSVFNGWTRWAAARRGPWMPVGRC